MPSHGDLRVWHIPQIPMKPFIVHVPTLVEARLVLDVLAVYDKFQFDNNVKRAYSNAGGLSIFDAKDDTDGPNGSWVDWYDEDGDSIEKYDLGELRRRIPKCASVGE
jgi:hypothetical protein